MTTALDEPLGPRGWSRLEREATLAERRAALAT
jgi:hypothetical protein